MLQALFQPLRKITPNKPETLPQEEMTELPMSVGMKYITIHAITGTVEAELRL
jgi:hypothetical protein